jgi:hypothetical protein
MRSRFWRASVLLSLVPTMALALGGCGQGEQKGDKPQAQKKQAGGKKETADDSATWWCREHGIPEHDCAQCDAKVASEYKKKGDWCKEHDRPESQCFICHPELKEKFAALYRTRYGKEPPPMEDEAKEGPKKEAPKK